MTQMTLPKCEMELKNLDCNCIQPGLMENGFAEEIQNNAPVLCKEILNRDVLKVDEVLYGSKSNCVYVVQNMKQRHKSSLVFMDVELGVFQMIRHPLRERIASLLLEFEGHETM